MTPDELKRLLYEVIEDEFSPIPVAIAPRWQGGKMVLHPGNDSQSKEIPLDAFFKKVIGIRESLRVLEQKINNHDQLSAEDKLTFASYITKAYGSLTTLNILFRDDKDRFHGTGGGGGHESSVVTRKGQPQMTIREAKAKLGIKEYGDE